ncbi:CO2+/MG2+ efflux protein ApaG [Planctomycetes bacterium Poly30]|uniref:CO2+/MG2+ efflux protein ApaG n=1 Tax=Saltatorellus ferox TaxID=2528018 RepID=A0A518EZB9_9BACT|nr:CO2+/MG2+ efflux protein ApaG [Planctomycetes bacterium Poly30]
MQDPKETHGESSARSSIDLGPDPEAQDAGPINMGPNSLCLTHGIEVEAAGQYLESRSFPEQKRWLYAYRVRIKNVGPVAQKLLSRHWIITDANGERREVRGVGVVGEQPRLEAGDSHEYRSMCDLSTAWGTMEGTYQFITDEGEEHEVRVGRFFLVESSDNKIVAE